MNSKHVIKDILNFILVDEKINLYLLNSNIIENKDKILKYLNNGYKVSTLSTMKQCEVCMSSAGPVSYFTDGYWIWPKWLNHYLTEHNIELPEKFLKKMKANNFEINKEFVKKIIENEKTFVE